MGLTPDGEGPRGRGMSRRVSGAHAGRRGPSMRSFAGRLLSRPEYVTPATAWLPEDPGEIPGYCTSAKPRTVYCRVSCNCPESWDLHSPALPRMAPRLGIRTAQALSSRTCHDLALQARVRATLLPKRGSPCGNMRLSLSCSRRRWLHAPRLHHRLAPRPSAHRPSPLHRKRL